MNPQDLQKIHETYAPKLREGGSVAVVQDWQQLFVRTRLLQKIGSEVSSAMVEGWGRGVQLEPVRHVPVHDIYGGWPALSLLLSHPIRLLSKEVQFLWPHVASSIVIKQQGEPLDAEIGSGTLLRNPHSLTICIDGDRDRRLLMKIIWSQAGGCFALFLTWVLLEWRMKDRSMLHQATFASPHRVVLSTSRHVVSDAGVDDGNGFSWGPVDMGCSLDDLDEDQDVFAGWPEDLLEDEFD
eukprot:g1308.t1